MIETEHGFDVASSWVRDWGNMAGRGGRIRLDFWTQMSETSCRMGGYGLIISERWKSHSEQSSTPLHLNLHHLFKLSSITTQINLNGPQCHWAEIHFLPYPWPIFIIPTTWQACCNSSYPQIENTSPAIPYSLRQRWENWCTPWTRYQEQGRWQNRAQKVGTKWTHTSLVSCINQRA